jgi:hypothetical protein
MGDVGGAPPPSRRFALRGGESAVEDTVRQLRSEFKIVLILMTSSVVSFMLTLPVLGFYKMPTHTAIVITMIRFPCVFSKRIATSLAASSVFFGAFVVVVRPVKKPTVTGGGRALEGMREPKVRDA